jgi:cytochrome c-type biogenesis protein CcmH
MSGWLIFLLFALVAGGALWFFAGRGALVAQLLGATLMVAAAGYAWQGHPGLAGHAVSPSDAPAPTDPAFAQERKDWMYGVGRDAEVLDTADTLIRNGDADYAVGILRGAITREPKDAMLWIGLGNALVQYGGHVVTPAARYAYDRAAMLAPGNPAPRYFLGLAYALSGDLATADMLWTTLVRDAPSGAAWRPRVAAKLLILRRLRGND